MLKNIALPFFGRMKLRRAMRKRRKQLMFDDGYGKLTGEGVWHVGKSELHFEEIVDAGGKPSGVYDCLIKNKLSFKSTGKAEHNTHYTEMKTGLRFEKRNGRFFLLGG